ncbi:uncharacterized protein LOC143250517 isoform X2 [Tachypleus tridentatus]|uniref:uncharacterized protein LOC143250517 isoform X2 n=1 Tax=Tachypleus tridentatus TaxID=6853 RepID=UPI003FD000C1
MKAHSSVELCVHTFLHTSTEGQTHLSILMVMQSSHGNRTCQSIRSMPSGGSRQTLSIHGRCESEQNLRFSRGQHSEKQECDSDDSLKWEEFFGTTVDISSSLLNMYDCLVGKSNDWDGGDTNEEDGSKDVNTDACQPPRCDHHNSCSRPRTRFPFRKSLSVNDSCAKRPLSTSSVSSSSSSSSSSLPRSGIDVKRSYLASIESLADISPDKDSNCSHDQNSHYNQSNGQAVANPEGCGQQAVNLEVCGQGSADLVTSGQEKVTARTSQGIMVSCHQQTSDLNLCPTNRVILEIVDTERTYVNDLQEIIEGYFQYLSTEDNKISKFTLRELSGNIEDIYKFNRNFLKELENCGLDPVEVSRCFVKNSTGFAIYTQYCTNYPRSVEVLTKLMQNSQTAEIFRERQLALRHRLPLGSYLLKPVQRITKYQLLLTNLVKHLDKDGDGYPDIKNAISVMTGLVFHINDMKRRHEDAVRVQEIQSLLYEWEGQDLTTYGELAAEGTFRMLGAKASRHLFLFDKILLIAKKKEEGKLSYKDHIMCSNLMLIESIQGEPLCFHVIPFNNPRLQYTFQARNLEQKREWCLELKRVILENYNAVIPSKARQLVMELGQNKEEASVPPDKNSSKRHLSAPEYLEKRKQERRKSEISLNKAFKLKKGNKKVRLHNAHTFSSTSARSNFSANRE